MPIRLFIFNVLISHVICVLLTQVTVGPGVSSGGALGKNNVLIYVLGKF